MTRRDKWLKPPRKRVAQYWAFCDLCRIYRVDLRNGDSIKFILPMPESWSQKIILAMLGQLHQSKPDLSNLLKALEDAVHPDDDSLLAWYSEIKKVWGVQGAIVITSSPTPVLDERSTQGTPSLFA
jgi:Holliday junction resolvase RusA-like endonuclease